MGNGMAGNLLRAEFPLVVYNRTKEKAEHLAVKGAQVADTPAAAAKDADVVISMLSDDRASRAAWLGADGALEAMSPDSVVVECGTVSPDWIVELKDRAAARGLQVLEAPVTGSRPQAEAGQLTFLVGSDEETLEAVRPVLVSMSKAVIHVGPVGAGGQLKLINNFLCGVQVASFAEAVAWVERTNLNRGQALDFLKTGAAGSGILTAMTDRMTARTYEVNFLLRLLNKDLRYAQQAAADKGVTLTTAAVTEKLFDRAETQGLGEKDMSAVVEVLRTGQGS
jgi:3-hydroxyisobutyrate dehydrogenase and related beta-hydroxyacid dehydrogenases